MTKLREKVACIPAGVPAVRRVLVSRLFRFDTLNKMAASERDQAVLESIFNPLLPLGDVPQKPPQNEINEESTDESIRAKELEALGVERAEQGDLDGAMECFNEACEICASRSSCFNNRAQLWRLKGNNI